MSITEDELNYTSVYLPNGSHSIREGFLTNWVMQGNCTVQLWFEDGFVIRTSVNNVFMIHKDV